MNWEAIGAVGEIGGAIAVVATLFYLTVQIRHSNRESQVNVAWTITSALNELIALITATPDTASLWHRGCQDFDSLDEIEQEHFVLLMATWANVLMGLSRTKDLSKVPGEYWDQVKVTFQMYMERPGFRVCVLTRRVNFPNEIFDEITEGYRDDA